MEAPDINVSSITDTYSGFAAPDARNTPEYYDLSRRVKTERLAKRPSAGPWWSATKRRSDPLAELLF